MYGLKDEEEDTSIPNLNLLLQHNHLVAAGIMCLLSSTTSLTCWRTQQIMAFPPMMDQQLSFHTPAFPILTFPSKLNLICHITYCSLNHYKMGASLRKGSNILVKLICTVLVSVCDTLMSEDNLSPAYFA